MNGLVLIDKPQGFTSHDVVNRWRRLAGIRRAGHLGTLDPLATGLLVLATGNATRLAQFYGGAEKTYLAEVTLGLVSNTYDVEGEVKSTGVPAACDAALVEQALKKFRGRLQQKPPAVSAKKINGVPAYKLARKNIAVDLEPVEVNISTLEMQGMEDDRLSLMITCSAGTYVRSLAHDLGQVLGCGALLSGLRRIRAGEFDIRQAWTLDQLAALAAAAKLSTAVIPSGSLLPHFPAVYVDAQIELQIRQGRDFRTSPFVVPPGTARVKAISGCGDLVAIGELKIPNVYHPSTVL
ncbi:MAG: tRNA pseudouridine(55) synthase TruB [Acidobacteriaceae bacterium]|nr:tRNA pseudouridine(55) synthase TruB [Acidobacteriaceae bacterium]